MINQEKLRSTFQKKLNELDSEDKKKIIKMQFKALVFLRNKLCRSCRSKVFNNVSIGGEFERKLLCDKCKVLLDKEIKD